MTEEILFKNNQGQKLSGVLHIPKGDGLFPAVLICSGLASYKEKPHYVNFRQELEKAGVVAFGFDYSGQGQSQGDFLDFTFSQGIEDAKAALKFLVGQIFVDKNKIGLSGTSLGALITLCLAAEMPQIKAMILMSPAIHYAFGQNQKLDEVKLKELQEKGWIDYHGYKLSYKFLQDSQKIKGLGLDILAKIKTPTLIMHGDQDKICPLIFSQKLFDILPCQKEFIVAENEGHDFRGKVSERVSWFKKYL